jgi:hypothetical protein
MEKDIFTVFKSYKQESHMGERITGGSVAGTVAAVVDGEALPQHLKSQTRFLML